MKIDCDCQPKCHKPKGCKCGCGVQIASVTIPAGLGTSEKGQPNAPENGAYKNAVVRYEADNTVFFYTSEGIPVKVGYGMSSVFSVNGKTGYVVLTTDDLENVSGYQTAEDVARAIGAEALIREGADAGLQSQIDALAASSDVTDVVGTYAALQDYDTSTLTDNDIIKVLQDEEHDDETTYYRWSTTTQTFSLIGEIGPYYTISAADAKFVDKTTYTDDITRIESEIASKQGALTAGANIQINGNTISATDTTYSAGSGLNLNGTTFSADTTTMQEKLTAGTNVQINGNTISATDTTYSNFTGTDGQTAGSAGLVPAPATTDADKVLGANGNWVDGVGATTFWGQSASNGVVTGDIDLGNAGNTTPKNISSNAGNNKVGFTYASPDNGEFTVGLYANNPNTQISSSLVVRADSAGGIDAYAPLDMKNNRIKNVATPTDGTDAANKNYVDSAMPSVVQTTGASTTDVMSQDAATKMVFVGGTSVTKDNICIGDGARSRGTSTIAIGKNADAAGLGSIAIGLAAQTTAYAEDAVALRGVASAAGSIAIGIGASSTVQGVMDIGTSGATYPTQYGYNNSAYRLISGVYDPQTAHDAATKGYVDTAISGLSVNVFTTNEWNALWS